VLGQPDNQNIKTLLASNKFTLKKPPRLLLLYNIPGIFIWLQLMELLVVVPVNYPSTHLFGEKICMLTKIKEFPAQQFSFQLHHHSFINELNPGIQWPRELRLNTGNTGGERGTDERCWAQARHGCEHTFYTAVGDSPRSQLSLPVLPAGK
jgi:hypothetical protein